MKNAAKIRHAEPFRRFFILLLVIILSIGASGCMKKRDIPEEMVQYMRDKYNEEFTLVAKDTQTWMSNYRMMTVEPAAFPGKFVEVWRNKQTGEITDSYLPLKVNADVEKEISAVTSEVYGENKVFNLASTVPDSAFALPDMPASDFLRLASGITCARIWVTKDPADKDRDVEAFRQALQDKGYYLTFYIIYIEKGAFSSLNEESGDKYYSNYVHGSAPPVTMAGYFLIDESPGFYSAEWYD